MKLTYAVPTYVFGQEGQYWLLFQQVMGKLKLRIAPETLHNQVYDFVQVQRGKNVQGNCVIEQERWYIKRVSKLAADEIRS